VLTSGAPAWARGMLSTAGGDRASSIRGAVDVRSRRWRTPLTTTRSLRSWPSRRCKSADRAGYSRSRQKLTGDRSPAEREGPGVVIDRGEVLSARSRSGGCPAEAEPGCGNVTAGVAGGGVGPAGSGACATRRSRTTDATPAGARRRDGVKWCKAIVVRAGTKVPRPTAGSSPPPESCASAPGAHAKYRELGTMANLLAFSDLDAADAQLLPRSLGRRPAAEEIAESARWPATGASCSIGCEHLQGAERQEDQDG
jgi:hypothetical protein